jgi:hypothetical protein
MNWLYYADQTKNSSAVTPLGQIVYKNCCRRPKNLPGFVYNFLDFSSSPSTACPWRAERGTQ